MITAESVVLLNAARIVEERGLAKGERQDGAGCVCLHGAISIACGGNADSPGGNRELEKSTCTKMALWLKANMANSGIADFPEATGCARWNNQEERTKEEVADALIAAANE